METESLNLKPTRLNLRWYHYPRLLSLDFVTSCVKKLEREITLKKERPSRTLDSPLNLGILGTKLGFPTVSPRYGAKGGGHGGNRVVQSIWDTCDVTNRINKEIYGGKHSIFRFICLKWTGSPGFLHLKKKNKIKQKPEPKTLISPDFSHKYNVT